MITVGYSPIQCKCSAILNPYWLVHALCLPVALTLVHSVHSKVDFMHKIWVCPFCSARNHFPLHYSEISVTSRPAEILAQCTTMGALVCVRLLPKLIVLRFQSTCSMPRPRSPPCSFSSSTRASSVGRCACLTLECRTPHERSLCVSDEELAQLKTSLLQSLMLLPENSLVGLITFGRNVSAAVPFRCCGAGSCALCFPRYTCTSFCSTSVPSRT